MNMSDCKENMISISMRMRMSTTMSTTMSVSTRTQTGTSMDIRERTIMLSAFADQRSIN